MVDVREVSRVIKDYFKDFIDKNVHEVDVCEANADLHKRIDDLDKHMWNSVEDSFPSDDRYILLSFENFSLPVIGRYEETADGGAFYAGDEDETLASQGMFVNAWMELPERYEEEIRI